MRILSNTTESEALKFAYIIWLRFIFCRRVTNTTGEWCWKSCFIIIPAFYKQLFWNLDSFILDLLSVKWALVYFGNRQCPSMLRLAKCLIIYQRWLRNVYKMTKGNDSLDNTMHVNIEKFVTNDGFKKVAVQLLVKIFDKNDGNISDIKQFLLLTKVKCSKLIMKFSKIKAANVQRLYGAIVYKLHNYAQKQQFGPKQQHKIKIL